MSKVEKNDILPATNYRFVVLNNPGRFYMLGKVFNSICLNLLKQHFKYSYNKFSHFYVAIMFLAFKGTF